jgi:hypothetical protein
LAFKIKKGGAGVDDSVSDFSAVCLSLLMSKRISVDSVSKKVVIEKWESRPDEL